MKPSIYRKCYRGGIGGWNCPCCAPPRGNPKKREARRLRKVIARLVMQHEQD